MDIVNKSGYSYKNLRPWTDSEIDRTISLLVAGYSISSIMERLNRSYYSVTCKISELRNNGIILPNPPRSPRSPKKLRYEMDHIDRNGPLLSCEAKEVTEPLTSPVTSASAKNPGHPPGISTSVIDSLLELKVMDSIHSNGYSATLRFEKGKLTNILID